ncbi:subtilisin-like protein [Leucogyrophana mollusca]|uniref:Subtilisin-like protein n=1 Tax=Leucogyrophana mollusca TaxID=85980 RepID=A0ACB8BSX8_9AGAM|nr:subtilisin-like protein [Leucogyrophana mollusca]
MLSLLSWLTLSLVVVSGATSPWTLHERRSHIPPGWNRARKHEPSAIIPLRIALTQPNIDQIGSYLNDVSHPDSPNYGDHWTPDQVATKFAPTKETINTVRDWLLQSGVDPARVEVSPGKGWLHVNSTVGEVEGLLRAKYYVYVHDTGAEHVASESYHLPAHVTPHVDFVTPTIHFDARLAHEGGPTTSGIVTKVSAKAKGCDEEITPSCLRALYGLPNKPVSAKKNSFGIVEFTPQTHRQSDLNSFAKKYSTGLSGVSPKMVSIDGGVLQTKLTDDNYYAESSADLEYGMSLVGPKQEVTLYQVGDTHRGASFNNFLDAIDGFYCIFENGDDASHDTIYPDNVPGGYKGKQPCGTVKPTNVISTSYKYNEADLSDLYAGRQCLEYGKLGIMGITVLYPSGDDGVEGGRGLCLTPKGKQTSKGKVFNPSFPASCPFVTAVGATRIASGGSVHDPESAWDHSGGGWSNYFGMPAYQADAVKSYLKHHHPGYSGDIWNSTGKSRAYPDLSAIGYNVMIVIRDEVMTISGTSLSTPIVGAILTLVNDARINAGKRPIGFINSAIYSEKFSGAFHDVTTGTNPGCGTKGFEAVKGWDPVTGLGTPNFPRMVEAWLKLR